MKKLILSIVLPLTMVCCQSEKNMELQDFPTYDCFTAIIMRGELIRIVDIQDNNIEKDNNVKIVNASTQHHTFCYDSNRYTDQEMRDMIKNKYTQ